MTGTRNTKQQSAFSWWLRTGRLPPVPAFDGIERKFNPWHDPSDGRFTFAGSGRYYGMGGSSAGGASDRNPESIDRQSPRKPPIATKPSGEAPRAGQSGQHNQKALVRGAIAARTKPTGSQRRDQANPAAEFIGGVAEGVYDVAEGTVAGAYAAVTTNPATTVRNVSRGIAGMIDTAIAAEDTPARVQVSRAASAVANASARDIGRATGSVAGNVALAVAPGAALARVSALRRLRGARPSAGPFPPPQIRWLKENLGPDSPAKRYNDAAPGARPGYAPALMRTMPDGSKRPVKFDGGEEGIEYPIDRKLKVVNAPRSRAQAFRQSDSLAQNRLTGTWEVPTPA